MIAVILCTNIQTKYLPFLMQTHKLVCTYQIKKTTVSKQRILNTIPLSHNLIGIWQITADILHLSRIRVTDFIISPPVVGTFDHDNICSRAAKLYGVTLAGQLPSDHSHGDWGTAESCKD